MTEANLPCGSLHIYVYDTVTDVHLIIKYAQEYTATGHFIRYTSLFLHSLSDVTLEMMAHLLVVL